MLEGAAVLRHARDQAGDRRGRAVRPGRGAARARRISWRAVDQRSGRRAGGLCRRLRPGAAVQHRRRSCCVSKGTRWPPWRASRRTSATPASRRASCPFTVLRSTTRWIGLNLRGKRRKPRDYRTAPNGAPSASCGALRGTGRRRAQADRGGGPEPGLVHAASVARAGGGGAGLLRARGVPGAVQALFAGEAVNWTEDKPAWHTALRAAPPARQPDGPGRRLRLRVRAHAGLRARAGPGGGHRRRAAYRHRRQRLGPRLAVQAFGGPTQRHVRSVSFRTSTATRSTTRWPGWTRRCLVVVSSKSFTTAETLHNARAAIAWAAARGVTDGGASGGGHGQRGGGARAGRAGRAGVLDVRLGGRPLFGMVGGGPVHRALTVGAEVLIGMRAGAEAMDQHFRLAPLASNAPAQLALAGWSIGDAGPQLAEHRGLQRAAAAPGDLPAAAGDGIAGQAGGGRWPGRGRAVRAHHLGHARHRRAAHLLPVAAPERERRAGGFHRQPARLPDNGRAPHAAGQLPGAAPGPVARQEPGAGAAGRGPYRRPRARAAPGAAHGASRRASLPR